MTAPIAPPRTIAEDIRARTGGAESARTQFLKPLMHASIMAAAEAQLRGLSDDAALAAARETFDREMTVRLGPAPPRLRDRRNRRRQGAKDRSFK